VAPDRSGEDATPAAGKALFPPVGDRVSHYRVGRRLGGGGMGEVYEAEDLRLRRTVAVKFLAPELSRDPDAKRRFLHEARAASVLDHPNICVVHEIDETDDGRLFIVMACYEGESLAGRCRRGPLPVAEALGLAAQVGEGLEAAHRHGILHRDVKPGNVVVTEEGVAKIVDFGLAKLTESSRLTRTGVSMGTPAYMSPEQLRGEPVDHRSDLWSLGVLLYELLTGILPFRGPAVTHTILEEPPPPPSSLRPQLPPAVDAVVARALEKDPDRRYPDAAALVDDLRRVRSTLSQAGSELGPAASCRREPRRLASWLRPVVVAGAVLVLGALGYGGWRLATRFLAPPEPPAESTEEALPRTPTVAVLPFRNVGAPEDEYFATGITEELTSRLAATHGLAVISRRSADQYRDTAKSTGEIARELDADYLLEGSVRWAGGRGGAGRVRITSELVRAAGDRVVWSQSYDRELDDIFEVQSDLAGAVLRGTDVVVAAPASEAEPPTHNLEAYQAYLRGLHFANQPHFTLDNGLRALDGFQRAVDLDPSFVLAWCQLSRAHGRMVFYRHDLSAERREMARRAAERAHDLTPDSAEVHLALAYYHFWVERDYDAALGELDRVAAVRPETTEILAARAEILRTRGEWTAAEALLHRAFDLDPRNSALAVEVAEMDWWLRRYPEALENANRAITLAPDQLWPYLTKVFTLWSWRGAIADARAALEELSPDEPWAQWSWFWQEVYEGKPQAALDRVAQVPGEWIRTKLVARPKALLEAQALELVGEEERAGASWEKARRLVAEEVAAHPEDPRYHSSLGVALAALGRRQEALREGRRGVELLPVSEDALYGISFALDLAHIHVLLGDTEAALEALEGILSIPGWVTPALVEMDPRWRRLRDEPRYRELLERYRSPASAGR
jgi:TolB-like protein/Flp pilus assembly protein TadD